MKKVVVLILLVIMTLSLLACNKDEDDTETSEEQTPEEQTPEEQTPEEQTPEEQTPEETFYTITFETNSDDEIGPVSLSLGASLDAFVPEKEGYVFRGWYATHDFTNKISEVPAYDVTIYAFFELDIMPDMVQVGELGTTYSIPVGLNDRNTHLVEGGYWMATIQTTYALWYTVRVWAEANDYHFANQGREGSHGSTGTVPTDASLEPVTMVNWRDVIVWLNALSEMKGLYPVYRDEENNVIRDSRGSNATIVDAALQTENNGYRLPTSREWEMSARWKNDTESIDGSVEVDGRWWTPGNYASGATDDYENAIASQRVAWYGENSKPDDFEWRKTRPVGQLNPNHLGIYDMSGNVYEYTSTIYNDPWDRILRGGDFHGGAALLQVGRLASSATRTVGQIHGFRIVRDA